MADLKKLYGFAESTAGGSPPSEPPAKPHFDWFWLHMSNGDKICYPYRYVGPIEIENGGLVIHCTCGSLKFIRISGEMLTKLAEDLSKQSIETIIEGIRPEYAKPEYTVVAEIEIVRGGKA